MGDGVMGKLGWAWLLHGCQCMGVAGKAGPYIGVSAWVHGLWLGGPHVGYANLEINWFIPLCRIRPLIIEAPIF